MDSLGLQFRRFCFLLPFVLVSLGLFLLLFFSLSFSFFGCIVRPTSSWCFLLIQNDMHLGSSSREKNKLFLLIVQTAEVSCVDYSVSWPNVKILDVDALADRVFDAYRCPLPLRLQLVDDTGCIDVIIPDLPPNVCMNGIYEVIVIIYCMTFHKKDACRDLSSVIDWLH